MVLLIARILILPSLSICIAAFSIVAFVHFSETKELVRFTAPDQRPFTITEPGKYTVWHIQYGTHSDGSLTTTESELPTGLTLHVAKASDGTTVTLASNLTTSVTDQSESRKSVADFEAPAAGQYTVTAQLQKETNPPTTLSIRPYTSFLKSFGILAAIAIVSSTIMLAGLIYAIIEIRKYLREKAA